MQFLTDELLTFKLGDLAPNPLPKLAPYSDVKSLAAAYIQLLSKLLGKSFSQIVKHEARLFPDEFVAPTQTLNNLLCLAMQSVHPDAEPGAWDAQEQVELQRVVQLVQSGKLESQEYCKLWEFFLVVLNEVKHALQAGQVWGVWDPVKQKEWFWEEMERVTGKDSIEGLEGLGSWGLWEAVEGWEVLLPLKVGWGSKAWG